MKVKKIDKSNKLMAVMADDNLGYFLRDDSDPKLSYYVSPDGLCSSHDKSLEEVLRLRSPSQAVYEGDSITLSF